MTSCKLQSSYLSAVQAWTMFINLPNAIHLEHFDVLWINIKWVEIMAPPL